MALGISRQKKNKQSIGGILSCKAYKASKRGQLDSIIKEWPIYEALIKFHHLHQKDIFNIPEKQLSK